MTDDPTEHDDHDDDQAEDDAEPATYRVPTGRTIAGTPTEHVETDDPVAAAHWDDRTWNQ